MLVKLCSHIECFEGKYGLKLKKRGKDFALRLKQIDEYMGYVAWAELYLQDNKKRELGI
jgi:hypothetical protein